MDVHKCIFYVTEKSIRAYVAKENIFEAIRKEGEAETSLDCINQQNFSDYFLWFDNNRALTEDDAIDYCFLSTKKLSFMDDMLDDNNAVSFQNAKQNKSAKSSWTKEEITDFVGKYLLGNFEIFVRPKQRFVCQTGNLYDKADLKQLYLFCIPEFKFIAEKQKSKKDSSTAESQSGTIETSVTTNVPPENAECALLENKTPQKNEVSEDVSITTKFFRDLLSAKRRQ